MKTKACVILSVVLFLIVALIAESCSPESYSVDGNTVKIKTESTTLRLQWAASDLVRISASPDGDFHDRQSLVVLPQEPFTDFSVKMTRTRTDNSFNTEILVSTDRLTVAVSPKDGGIRFLDAQGNTLLGGSSMDFTPIEVEEKPAYSTRISFDSPDDEAIYGLGQQQSGQLNHKCRSEELFQYNTKVSVPMVVSTKGYGLLFDAYSFSRWGNPHPYNQLGEVFHLFRKDGTEGGLTGTYIPSEGRPLVRTEDSLYFETEWEMKNLPKMKLKGAKVTYEGYLEAPVTADYDFIQYYAGFQRTFLNGEEVMGRRWRPAWNPNSYKFTVRLEAGKRTPIRVEWEPDGDVSYFGLRVASIQSEEQKNRISFWSEFEPQLDFWFIGGGSFDAVLRGYRFLTGKAQVMPKWAMGFWQSRERYRTQDELVGTLAEFRRRGIPVDNIVQDWQYWKEDQWGSHEFDPDRFPDPEGMLDDVHALHGRFMISVWPKFYTNTEHYRELKLAGYAYTHAEDDGLLDFLGHPETFYDAYSEGGRKMFWSQMDESLYSRFGRKIDAWWMDASEPNLRDCLPMDYQKWLLTPTALGPSTEYFNAYALVNAQAIYNGQRGVDPDKRVFLLTRNGFAGLQRYSTATWSGDIGTSWTDMRTQMSAGLNYCMSGIPFWGMDIGGFSVMDKFYDRANLDEWRELQTRWHQFGTFVPLFRTHGQWPCRELWNIAPEGSVEYETILWYIRLRYRMMPYLYSLAGLVHFSDYTLMRALVMDYPEDMSVRDLDSQWMFGPSFMPCPVSEYGARSREVYFPEGGWYDFYSGEYVDGGRSCSVAAPLERMPLFVRGGSIVPFGPDIQWTDQFPADKIKLLVYAGADAEFTLYEDDGLTYGYERGEYATIPIKWDETAQTLTLGRRSGSYPGMPEDRSFSVIIVDPEHPVGCSVLDDDAAGVEILYSGESVSRSFRE